MKEELKLPVMLKLQRYAFKGGGEGEEERKMAARRERKEKW